MDEREESAEFTLPDGTRRRVKRLRHLGETWVPEKVLRELLEGTTADRAEEKQHAEEE